MDLASKAFLGLMWLDSGAFWQQSDTAVRAFWCPHESPSLRRRKLAHSDSVNSVPSEVHANNVIALRSPCLLRDVRIRGHMSLVSILVAVLILALICYVITIIPAPPVVKQIAYVVVAILAILVLVGYIPLGVR
jgi:uncharacterized membrane protein